MNEVTIADLYQTHGHALFHACLRLVGVASSARELVQATFCEFAKTRLRFVSKGARFAYLCRLAKALARPMPEPTRPGAEQDIQLARYLADDLPRGERLDLDDALKANQSLQVRLAVMRSDRAAFYTSDPPAQFAQRVATVLRSRGAAPAGIGRVVLITLAMAAVVAAGVAGLRAFNDPPAAPQPSVAIKVVTPPASQPASQPTSPSASAPASAPAPAVPAAPVAVVPVATAPPPAVPTPAAAPVVAPKAAPTSAPSAPATTDAVRMMATFDFGETLGRISLYEGRSKQKAVPSGTSLQVRANIPEPGFAAVYSFDPETQVLTAIAGLTKVEPGWRILGRLTIDKAQRVYMVFTLEATPLSKLTSAFSKAIKEDAAAPLPIERQARIDLTLE